MLILIIVMYKWYLKCAYKNFQDKCWPCLYTIYFVIIYIIKMILTFPIFTFISVVNAALGMIIAAIFKTCFVIYGFIGSIILALFFRFPEKKLPLTPIGNRKLLRQSVTEIADQVKNFYSLHAIYLGFTSDDRIN